MGQKFPFGTPQNLNALTLEKTPEIWIAQKSFLPLPSFLPRYGSVAARAKFGFEFTILLC
jgi:hypothetical protein